MVVVRRGECKTDSVTNLRAVGSPARWLPCFRLTRWALAYLSNNSSDLVRSSSFSSNLMSSSIIGLRSNLVDNMGTTPPGFKLCVSDYIIVLAQDDARGVQRQVRRIKNRHGLFC